MKKVTLIEVGPRDGFQFEERVIPTELKAEIIEGLADAGLSAIQVASFVNPARVPQMADAEELIGRLSPRKGVAYSALALSARGVERAARSGIRALEVSISLSDTHSRRNTGMTLAEAARKGKKMVALARENGMWVRAGVQCAFGCVFEGKIPLQRVVNRIRDFIDTGPDMLAVADTTGMATPPAVRSLLERVLPVAGAIPLALHLHDTRGLGLVNLSAALEFGLTHFDTAFGGLGGCPFVPGAAGNLATEDAAYLLEALGYRTGVDIGAVAACSRKIEAFLGKPLAGRMYRQA